MKFKNYPREYERVYTGAELVQRKCDLDRMSVYRDRYTPEEYLHIYKQTARGFRETIFDYLVKTVWLNRSFCYVGQRRKKDYSNGVRCDMAFATFLKSFVSVDNRLALSSLGPFPKIITYFDDFFPNFIEGDPFQETYEYPYEYMSLECLVVVYQMDERLDLLAVGEKRKMSYAEFLDYIVNYINCYNDEHGEKYMFIYSHVFMPYIKKIKKKPKKKL